MPAETLSIEVKVTDRCNQRCFHCMNDDTSSKGRDIDCDLFLDRLREWGRTRETSAVDFSEIRMTGGEPLLNLPAVCAIGQACRGLHLRSGINTNATLLDKDACRLLHAAGISTVKISFDSLDDDVWRAIRGPEASLARTEEGIKLACAAGFNVIVRFTLCSLNRNQMIPCYHACRGWGVDKFQVKPLISSGRAAGSGSFLGVEELCRSIRELAEAVSGPEAAPEILCWPPERAAGLAARPCSNVTKIYVGTDGTVLNCNYLGSRPVAHLRDKSLEESCRHGNRQIERASGGHSVLAGCPAWTHWQL